MINLQQNDIVEWDCDLYRVEVVVGKTALVRPIGSWYNRAINTEDEAVKIYIPDIFRIWKFIYEEDKD